MNVTLYRASDHPEAGKGQAFSPDIDVARAYLDNPGFGGHTIWKYEVEIAPGDLLKLYGNPWRVELALLSEAIGGDVDPYETRDEMWRSRGLYRVYEVLLNDQTIEDELRDAGYSWVSYRDDFPNIEPPPETWWKLSTGKIVGEGVEYAGHRPLHEWTKLKKKLLR